MQFIYNPTSCLYQGKAPSAFISVDEKERSIRAIYVDKDWTVCENLEQVEGNYAFSARAHRSIPDNMGFQDRVVSDKTSKILENREAIARSRGLPKEVKDLVGIILKSI